jgi:hypothetical protein
MACRTTHVKKHTNAPVPAPQALVCARMRRWRAASNTSKHTNALVQAPQASCVHGCGDGVSHHTRQKHTNAPVPAPQALVCARMRRWRAACNTSRPHNAPVPAPQVSRAGIGAALVCSTKNVESTQTRQCWCRRYMPAEIYKTRARCGNASVQGASPDPEGQTAGPALQVRGCNYQTGSN